MQSRANTKEPEVIVTVSSEGLDWWTRAWRMFTRFAGLWILIGVITVLLPMLGDLVPTVGWLISGSLSTVFDGGALIAAAKQEAGGVPEVNNAFAGFRQQFVSLAILGLVLAVAYHVALIISVAIAGGGASILLTRDLDFAAIDPIALLVALMILLVLVLPILMAAWFATALVVFDRQNPFTALKLSFVASSRNVPALTVFGLLQVVFDVIATIPLGLGWLVLNPVTTLAAYSSYRAVFRRVRRAPSATPA